MKYIIIVLCLLFIGCTNEYKNCSVSYENDIGFTLEYEGSFARYPDNMCCIIPGYDGNVNDALNDNKHVSFCTNMSKAGYILK